jgi:hypothetical protein
MELNDDTLLSVATDAEMLFHFRKPYELMAMWM